jgi:hypothetical protein
VIRRERSSVALSRNEAGPASLANVSQLEHLMTDDPLRWQEETDQASITSAFLGVLAASLLSVGAPAVVLGEFPLALSALTFALVFAFLAYQWPTLAPKLQKTLTRPFDTAATSAWCWAILLLIFAAAIMLLALSEGRPTHQSPDSNLDRGTVAGNHVGLDIAASPSTSEELTWQNDWVRQRLMDFPTTSVFRTKYSATEVRDLIAKSSELLQITRKGVPLFQQWQSMLTTNPERVCLGLDLSTLSNTSARLADEFHKIQTEQQSFLDKNTPHDKDLLPLINNGKLPASSHDVVEFELAAMSLERYTQWMRGLNDHPTCDNIVATGELATQSLNVNQALWRLGFWLGLTQSRINSFQAKIQLGAGDSP